MLREEMLEKYHSLQIFQLLENDQVELQHSLVIPGPLNSKKQMSYSISQVTQKVLNFKDLCHCCEQPTDVSKYSTLTLCLLVVKI